MPGILKALPRKQRDAKGLSPEIRLLTEAKISAQSQALRTNSLGELTSQGLEDGKKTLSELLCSSWG